jgi:hypothetical protein
VSEHNDDCGCVGCVEDAERLRALLLAAVEDGLFSEDDVLDAIVSTTERPEIVAMIEDYRLREDL